MTKISENLKCRCWWRTTRNEIEKPTNLHHRRWTASWHRRTRKYNTQFLYHWSLWLPQQLFHFLNSHYALPRARHFRWARHLFQRFLCWPSEKKMMDDLFLMTNNIIKLTNTQSSLWWPIGQRFSNLKKKTRGTRETRVNWTGQPGKKFRLEKKEPWKNWRKFSEEREIARMRSEIKERFF